MMTTTRSTRTRRGTIVPFLAIALVGLFGFVALAIDLGLLMVARGQDQNAADAAALVGTRLLDNKPTSIDSNRAEAEAAAHDVLDNNHMINDTDQIITVTVGVYDYNTTTQSFEVSYPDAPPPGRSWTAMKIEIVGSHSTYFAKVFGITSMQTGATAVAVHRPRDIAVVLDITGSMRFGSPLAANSVYLSADPIYPQMGHYQRFTDTALYTTTNPNASRPNPFHTTVGWVDPSSGELWAPNNYTERTAGGPPVVRDFCYDAFNLADPSTPVVTPNPNMTNPTVTPPLPNAFHHWDPLVTGLGDPDTYIAPTYNFAGWPYATTQSYPNLYPTPAGFKDQTDAFFALHGGDRWPRKGGSERSVSPTVTWSPTHPNGATITLMEYLGWAPAYSGGSTVPVTTYPSGRNAANFRDATWERFGYDLDVEDYIANRDTGGATWDPRWDWDPDALGGLGAWAHEGGLVNPPATTYRPRKRTDTTFKGYTLGPGYWGKTFFIWPPDPRPQHDWRRKFFLRGDGNGSFDPQDDNRSSVSGVQHINELMFTGSTGHTLMASGSSTYRINYDAILAWIKTAPMCLPPNLRAGRIVYYTSIPNDVDTSTGTAEQQLDKVFWRRYIEFVLRTSNINSSENRGWPEGVSPSILTTDLDRYTASGFNPDPRPYMPYNDNPSRPRAQLWFGPITMLAFLASGSSQGYNMWPGTVHESQNWQLKAGMNSAMDDIRNNHPNDALGLAYFSYVQYGEISVALGQDWVAAKRALFYPQSMLDANLLDDPTREYRPYNSSFNYLGRSNVPNAQQGTDPNTGLAMGFNILSPSPFVTLPPRPNTTSPTAPRNGRRGASKIVIFETDGVPNSYRTLNFVESGWRSYYEVSGNGGSPGNGSSTAINQALSVVDRIVAQMAIGTSGPSGLSSPNSPARVYSIGFGDLFSTPSATFQPIARQFLLDIQKRGGTSAATDTAIPDYQIITGGYQDRIDGLRTALERILQSGVQVTLIE